MLNVSSNNGEAFGCFSCRISATVLPSIKSESLRTLVSFLSARTLLRFDVPSLNHFSEGSEFLLGVALLSSHRFA